ncbi:EthD domain-containing protein [Fusarium falciforme]|uniref:EthD domain-containing protein n=1 Tax=Fusarium falciforme TaxID=195108 RepID=UPI0023018D82|nr:EthD domain-containing protein [Fusarium falciforme]WAO85141.1 EthD domain-containing protein [Fusarium falciforme]
MPSKTHQLFSVTIFGYRKPGMDEDAYHQLFHITWKQHNSTKGRALIDRILPNLPSEKVDDADCIVQIVFRDIEDYVKVKNEEKFKTVVDPDHAVFSDPSRTKFVTGWFEFHITDGDLV